MPGLEFRAAQSGFPRVAIAADFEVNFSPMTDQKEIEDEDREERCRERDKK